jgi:effector-binding domain-containing protein
MDQEIIIYSFNISEMDMASRRYIGSTRETERVYDSLIWKEVENRANLEYWYKMDAMRRSS